MSKEQPIYLRRTYCNPISMPDCPKGEDNGWSAMAYTEEPPTDYRSISDPSVLYYDNKWYLYPSYGMSFVSEDFVTWKHVRSTPYNMKYSPSVIPHRGRFLMTSHSNGLYIGDTPVGPFTFVGDFIQADGSTIQPIDSALFQDDDGRIYLYWFDFAEGDENIPFTARSLGVELDGDDPRYFVGEPKEINRFCPENPWEHNGPYNEDTEFGWIEGQWMLKHNGRYYFIYACPGTEFKSYCMAAYYSDEGPLSGFVCQKRNPLTEHRHGLVSGAGHGCVAHGPNNSLWAFYTTTVCAVHCYERRIGMDPIFVDENGELYCNGVTDTPQFGYGEAEDPMTDNSTGLLPVTFSRRQMVRASSAVEGRSAFYALDESMQTWWQPSADDSAPTLTVNTGSDYVCEAARIIWRDIGMNYEKGVLPGAFRYVIEGREVNGEWVTLLDRSESNEDYNIDYRTFPPVTCRELRLRVVGAPKGITPGVTSFTVFGKRKSTIL